MPSIFFLGFLILMGFMMLTRVNLPVMNLNFALSEHALFVSKCEEYFQKQLAPYANPSLLADIKEFQSSNITVHDANCFSSAGGHLYECKVNYNYQGNNKTWLSKISGSDS